MFGYELEKGKDNYKLVITGNASASELWSDIDSICEEVGDYKAITFSSVTVEENAILSEELVKLLSQSRFNIQSAYFEDGFQLVSGYNLMMLLVMFKVSKSVTLGKVVNELRHGAMGHELDAVSKIEAITNQGFLYDNDMFEKLCQGLNLYAMGIDLSRFSLVPTGNTELETTYALATYTSVEGNQLVPPVIYGYTLKGSPIYFGLNALARFNYFRHKFEGTDLSQIRDVVNAQLWRERAIGYSKVNKTENYSLSITTMRDIDGNVVPVITEFTTRETQFEGLAPSSLF